MWTFLILPLLLLQSSGASLREQVASLKREQWRDRERIEALERRARSERDSPTPLALPDAVIGVLEELGREMVGLTEELRRRQDLEVVVEAIGERQRQEQAFLRRLSDRVERIEEEQRRVSLVLTGVDISKAKGNSVGDFNPWAEAGSGDLLEDYLIPAVNLQPEKNGHVHNTEVASEDKNSTPITHRGHLDYIYQLETSIGSRLSNLSERLDVVQRETHRVEALCNDAVENATDDMQSSMALMENLQDDLSTLWKRVAKVEFNSAQSQAGLDVLERDWVEDRKHIRELQNDLKNTEKDLKDQGHRLIVQELLTTNLTLQKCQGDSDITKRHLRLENIEFRVAQTNHRIDEWQKRSDSSRKLDEDVLRNYRNALSTIARRAENVSNELAHLSDKQAGLRFDVNKFIQRLPKDCSSVSQSGLLLIHVPELGPLEVYCDTKPKGGPWIVFQRRTDGSENFFRNWIDYKKGFGNASSEFWVGNEILHFLTRNHPVKLHIDMWDVHDRYLYAEYKVFNVRSESEEYSLEVANHTGNASDALTHHLGLGFSTFDRDNDASSANCAVHHTGGWWYQHCHRADLNGRYSLGMTWYDEFSREWLQLQRVEMKIASNRPR